LVISSGGRRTQHPPNHGAATRHGTLAHQLETVPLVEGDIPWIRGFEVAGQVPGLRPSEAMVQKLRAPPRALVLGVYCQCEQVPMIA
jgi:hypothetical protein